MSSVVSLTERRAAREQRSRLDQSVTRMMFERALREARGEALAGGMSHQEILDGVKNFLNWLEK